MEDVDLYYHFQLKNRTNDQLVLLNIDPYNIIYLKSNRYCLSYEKIVLRHRLQINSYKVCYHLMVCILKFFLKYFYKFLLIFWMEPF